jgi:hypothetical protein
MPFSRRQVSDEIGQSNWRILGRLVRAVARAEGRYEDEMPPVGRLVVEASHAWRLRKDWPELAAIGYVERVEPEDAAQPLRPGNSRVVIRRLDDGSLQPWVNAMFFVAPEEFVAVRGEQGR